MTADLKTKLINRTQVREFARETARSRAHRFTRVSGQFLFTCEAQLKEFIRAYIRRLPSKGRTIM